MKKGTRTRIRVTDSIKQMVEPVDIHINFVGHINEIKLRVTENMQPELQKRETKYVRAEMKGLDYIELTDLKSIKKIFQDNYDENIKKFFTGGHLFFVWKYSQLLKVTDNKKEREDFISALEDIQVHNIVDYLRKSGVCRRAQFIDDEGRIETSRGNKLIVRKENGKMHWVKDTNSRNNVPSRDYFDIYDLSLSMIKKVLEVLDKQEE